jgi:glycosyltransferase involved in cell wall biosynthesis
MDIALVLPHVYFLPEISKDSIFAPGYLYEMLAKGLIDAGHKVTCISAWEIDDPRINNLTVTPKLLNNSCQKKKLSYLDLQKKHARIYKKCKVDFCERIISTLISENKKSNFDIVHIFSVDNPILLSIPRLIRTKVVYTNHDPYDMNPEMKKAFLANKNLNYISISNSQRNGIPDLNFVSTVYNSIDTNNFCFKEKSENYYASIGRIIYPKGVHRAIEVTKRLGAELRIAGKYYAEFGDEYFHKHIEKHVDNKQIKYFGFINNPKQKSEFLGNAKALLFPVDWNEPFGLVMIEALATGTPVIAFDRGSVREIIQNGVNGYIVKTKSAMVKAMQNIDKISRKDCRESALKRFAAKIMIENYIATYEKVISNTSSSHQLTKDFVTIPSSLYPV